MRCCFLLLIPALFNRSTGVRFVNSIQLNSEVPPPRLRLRAVEVAPAVELLKDSNALLAEVWKAPQLTPSQVSISAEYFANQVFRDCICFRGRKITLSKVRLVEINQRCAFSSVIGTLNIFGEVGRWDALCRRENPRAGNLYSCRLVFGFVFIISWRVLGAAPALIQGATGYSAEDQR